MYKRKKLMQISLTEVEKKKKCNVIREIDLVKLF